jgi:hypothetical protein
VKLSQYYLYAFSFIWTSGALAIQVTGNADVQTLSLGESFTYTIAADANLGDDALDIRPLFKDFIIGNLQIAHPSNTETTWMIPLQPVSSGEIIIPALKVGDGESPQLTLTVSNSSNLKQNIATNSEQWQSQSVEAPQPSAHLLESQVNTETVYKNELLTYTVTVVKRADPENRPPVIAKLDNAQVISAGDPVEDKQIFGDHYQETIAYTYFIFPEKEGILTLPSATLASDKNKKSNEHTIEVKSAPSSFHESEKKWLPSAGISIDERWEPQTSYVKIGQPLTRTITITGINNIPEQLPDISTPTISDIRVYRDNEKSDLQYQNGMVISKRVIKQVFIPEKNVPFTAPAVDIKWWNTISDRAQVVSLDERKFMASLVELKTKQDASSAKNKQLVTDPNSNKSANLLKNILVIFGCIVAFFTPIVAIFWFYRKALRNRYNQHCIWNNFKKACLSNDPLSAYKVLLIWSSQHWQQQFTCLEQLPFYTRLKVELDELQAACFSKTAIEWTGKKLFNHLSRRTVLKSAYKQPNSEY